jgi:hypothetical protein
VRRGERLAQAARVHVGDLRLFDVVAHPHDGAAQVVLLDFFENRLGRIFGLARVHAQRHERPRRRLDELMLGRLVAGLLRPVGVDVHQHEAFLFVPLLK